LVGLKEGEEEEGGGGEEEGGGEECTLHYRQLVD
jgi:hypothetical protein